MLAVYEYRFKTDRVFVIDCLEYKRLEWSMGIMGSAFWFLGW